MFSAKISTELLDNDYLDVFNSPRRHASLFLRFLCSFFGIINVACVREVIIEISGVTFHCLLFFLYFFLTYFAGIRGSK